MSDRLIDRCTGFAHAGRAALAWVHDAENADYVGQARQAVLDRSLRKYVRRAEKLGAAAASHMAVSVYGPSQNGKSFLISVLARPQGGLLIADYAGPDGQMDYISQINPAGEGESTGLVTRFTLQKPLTPEGFPIPLTLLSEADILQTIANSFFNDGDESEEPLTPEQLQAHIDAFASQADGGALPGLTPDDVWEIADYFDRNFKANTYADRLTGFWPDAARIAPRLSRDRRAQFFAILWGKHDEFTTLYRRLGAALDKIGHPSALYTGTDALIPRDTSIIDVAVLRHLGKPDEQPLGVRTPAGQTLQLGRGEVCALAAELVLPMRDEPDPMFAHTDLLDFPGARNRFTYNFAAEFRNPDADRLPNLFLRGKVAFLFDRYVEAQAINAMLLCIRDSNMEAKDLPGLVENWIAMTQGRTPEERAQIACILFFVMTFFDKHLTDSAAGADDTERFNKRVFMSLLEKFRKSEGWVDHWAPDQPFDNCFWVRNPNFWVEALFDYEKHEDGRTTETLKPEKVARIGELKDGCLKAPNVRAHFRDPEAAWDAAMAENDGGVTYLVSHLKAVCQPGAKARQIDGQMRILEKDLLDALGEFHVSDDLLERRAKAEEAANAVIDGLEIARENRSFSSLIAALMVDQDTVMDRMAQLPSKVRIGTGAPDAAPRPGNGNGNGHGAAAAPARPGRPMRPGGPRPEAAPAPVVVEAAPINEVRTLSREAFQAETAMAVWAERLEALKSDTRFIRGLGMTPDAIATLVAELQKAARRLALESQMVTALAELKFGLTLAQQARPSSLQATEMINRFVTTLGNTQEDLTQRAKVPTEDGDRPVFKPKPQIDDAQRLPDQPRPALDAFWTDWVYALYALFTDNAMDGQDDRGEQNLRLGQIIAAISEKRGQL